MANESSLQKQLSWIDLNNNSQCEWATSYLTARQFSRHAEESNARYFERVELKLSSWAAKSTDSKEAVISLIKKMRAAWNTKKNRSKSSGRKAYSYVMSTAITRKLHQLSGDRPINTTLEEIINNEYEVYRSENKISQTKLRDARNKHDRLQQQIDDIKKQLDEAKNKIKSEQEINKKIIETVGGLYLKVATQEVMIRSGKSKVEELNDIEKKEAIDAKKIKLDFFMENLASEIAAMGMRLMPRI